MDKSIGSTVHRVIFQCPTAMGKGVLVTQTVDGNTMIGPDAQDIGDAVDTSTTKHGQEYVRQSALKVVPDLDLRHVITSFAGIRAKPVTGDFIIGPSKVNANFINVAGIESPGLSCAPAVGEYVCGLLKSQGLKMTPKKSFKRTRDKVMRFRELEYEELGKLIEKDASYSRLVCRCEKVTEGEVVDCIRRHAGALDLDAVKEERVGNGTLPGGFCTKIVELLSRELRIPYDKVTKKEAIPDAGGQDKISRISLTVSFDYLCNFIQVIMEMEVINLHEMQLVVVGGGPAGMAAAVKQGSRA